MAAAAYSLCGWWIVVLLSCMVRNEVLGCLEDEKIALLKLKDVINHQNGSVPKSWSDEEPDCCRWKRVTCDVFSKRIIKLFLSPLICWTGEESGDWFLDASLFQPFQELQNLNFQCGQLKGLQGQLKLKKLQVLDLSGNDGISQVPLLGELPSLKFLDLSWNAISHGFEGLCALTNLEELYLIRNEIEGSIPTCLSNLTYLRLLDLSENQFSGTIPSNIFSSLKSLEYISLSSNHFDGLFSFSSLTDNSKLEVFRLESDNPRLKVDTENVQWKHPIFQLKILVLSNCIVNEPNEGVVPSFLLSQYDLRIVDLSNNGMMGELPSWLLTNNSRLEFLSLTNNSFTGRLTLQLDSFNAYLVSLDISMNQVAGEIPTFIGSILPILKFWNMSVNAIEGSIPSSIENMSELISLDLSNNRLSGEIPEGLFIGCENLEYLKLSNNKLRGDILPKNMSKFPSLYYLYLDSNNFSGRFPDWTSELSGLTFLDMSENHFEGKLPSSFCNLTELIFIDLSWNNFGDTLPSCTNLSSLMFLHLQGNMFHGPLPTSLSRSSSMVTLDVTDNNFSGLIPAWISSLSQLMILLLKGNIFHGSIPSELCQMENFNILDLSANNLSGSVPPCLSQITFGKTKNLDYKFKIRTSNTSYIQEEVQFITKNVFESYKGNILYFMSAIDLSLNKLTGHIPQHIDNWDMVHSLNLSYNNFNGSIPWTLSRLKRLESLDLSHNMLSGEIPSQITELNFLSVFSVAYNNLSGPTPTTTSQFATFDASSYKGNPLLCGLPLDGSCINGRSSPPQHAKPSTEREQNDTSFKTTFLWSFSCSFIVSCIGACVFFHFNTIFLPERFLRCIGVEMVPPRRTIRFA